MIVIAQAADAATEAQTAKQLFQQGKVEESIPHFQRAVELREKDPTAWYNLAYANRKAGHFAEAARAYGRYAQLAPDDPDGYFGLAESLRQTGRGAEARQAYETYLSKETRPSEEKWKAVARQRILELAGQSASVPSLQKPLPLPLPPPAQPPAAQAPSTQAPAAQPPQTPAPSAQAPAVQLPASPAPSAQAPAAQPPAGPSAPAPTPQRVVPRPDPAALTAQGDAALAAKDLHGALFAYQEAVMADGKYAPARVKLGHVYVKMGHQPEAAEQWSKALQLDPQNAEARAALAGLRQPSAAVAQPALPAPAAPPRVQQDEAAAKAHYTKGVALVNDRKYQDALPELDQAVAQKPRFAIAFVARGSARVGLGQYEAAVADYSAAREADPSLAAPLFGLAEAYRALGQPEKAADYYRQYAASTAPDAQARLKQYALDNAQALAPR